MSPRSSILRLPKEIQEKIHQLYESGHSYRDISDKLASIGTMVSPYILGRHIRKRKKIATELRRSREVAESVVSQLGGKSIGQQQKLLIELFHSAMLDLFLPQKEETSQEEEPTSPVKGNPKELATLATALHTLARVQQMTLESAKTLAAPKKTHKKSCSTKGLSPDTVAQIMKTAFGVRS